ncbi:MAG: class I SAM-dependent methyltransferase [Chloroflexi bacterium]|nr:class I SAM-dependent methyltransferase [Chloroflexota bacterium]
MEIVPAEIEAYAAKHTTPLPALLQELAAATEREFGERAGMLSGQVPGQLLQTLIFAMGARRVLEIGMFTGLSAQMMAAALPADGRIITCDVDPKAIALAKQYFSRGQYADRIDVRQGPALETMRTLEPGFDLIFIDADKGNYANYYEAALPLLAPRGIIAIDNVLWSGRVLDPKDDDSRAIVAFNEMVRADVRVEQVMLTVRDGITLVRRRQA